MFEIEPIYCSKIPQNLRSSWQTFLDQTDYAGCQYNFETVSCWTDVLRERWNPLILLAKDRSSQIRGIVPLMFNDKKRRNLIPYRRVRFLASSSTDFSRVLASRVDQAHVTRAALEWLVSGEFRWQQLILDDLVGGLEITNAVWEWCKERQQLYTHKIGKYYFIDLNQSWEKILENTHRRFVRRNVKEAMNRLKKAGKWRVCCHPRWDANKIIELAAGMHIKRQKILGRTSLYDSDRGRKYARALIESNQNSGSLSSFWFEFEKRYIAYLIGFEEQNVFYAWNMSFDPQYSHFSPSRCLLFAAVKDCHRRGLKEFSWMRGEADYKPRWSPSFRENHRFTIHNNSGLYNQSLIFLDASKRRIDGTFLGTVPR